MNGTTLHDLERAYKDANAWYDELYAIRDVFMLDKHERKAYRKALARAEYDRKMALIELDAAWEPPVIEPLALAA